MTRFNKFALALGMALAFSAAAGAPEVETVLQRGFPTQASELVKTTNKLHSEYKKQNNVSSLVFYSYGMLRLANHYKSVNDVVNASEYAKLGFFWLDEAVDSHENDARVRYLRMRIDAYLPEELGRCVVALNDANILLRQKETWSDEIVAHINFMRYRALLSCKKDKQAAGLLEAMKNGGAVQARLLALGNGTPEWDASEVTQIVMPLVKGE
ncbi:MULTISPECIES: hypothetical protein [Tenebrionibacter/Tenebrionicola group]|jgi:hypothetical protein|uniref:Sel1 repeat family protein n=1 Tax=Tenebrionibacter intestinalis TaxID=2799638 RepID=A0A8K0V1K3_9ENTR|nr:MULTISPECIES: hypothetical protein [Tenebrionibacter/Tenebrionicola group]MBK4715282.1 hypothetical protein [Tenebrionibacter intestinalis]MBV4413074.1 hypothetical protein [Tenebrionicola larvae]